MKLTHIQELVKKVHKAKIIIVLIILFIQHNIRGALKLCEKDAVFFNV